MYILKLLLLLYILSIVLNFINFKSMVNNKILLLGTYVLLLLLFCYENYLYKKLLVNRKKNNMVLLQKLKNILIFKYITSYFIIHLYSLYF